MWQLLQNNSPACLPWVNRNLQKCHKMSVDTFLPPGPRGGWCGRGRRTGKQEGKWASCHTWRMSIQVACEGGGRRGQGHPAPLRRAPQWQLLATVATVPVCPSRPTLVGDLHKQAGEQDFVFLIWFSPGLFYPPDFLVPKYRSHEIPGTRKCPWASKETILFLSYRRALQKSKVVSA